MQINNQLANVYLCDGRKFKTYEQVIIYCEANKFRISNTETLRPGVYLIDVRSIDYASKIKSFIS